MLKFIQCLLFALSVFSVTILTTANASSNEDLGISSGRPGLNRVPEAAHLPVSIDSRYLTNAVRMARGLPPRPPKAFGHYLPGHHTPTVAARAPNASPQSFSGKIEVTKTDGSFVGYIKKTYAGSPYHTITTDTSLALLVTTSATSPSEITETNGPDPAHPFLGIATRAGSGDFSSTSSNYGYLTGSSHTAAGSPPAAVGNSFSSAAANSESTIWTVDASKGLTATWINSNGVGATTTYFYYLPASSAIFATGNPSAFDTFGGYVVKFVLV